MTIRYTGLTYEEKQAIAAQVLRAHRGEALSLSTTDAWAWVPPGVIGAALHCASSNFYWDLDRAAAAAEALGSELLSNEGFEDAGEGNGDVWADWTEVVSDGALDNETSVKRTGSDAAKVTAGASVDTCVKQAVAVEAGQLVKVVIYSYGTGTNDGCYKVYDATNEADIIALAHTGATAASWVAKTVYVLVPAGCTSVEVYLYCTDTDTEVCYYDDISVKVVTLASGLMTAATWLVVALHPDVEKLHAILAAGAATLQINWLLG